METIAIYTRGMYRGVICQSVFWIMMVLFLFCTNASAQTIGENSNDSILESISREARQLFDNYIPKKDSAQTELIKKYRKDKFIKRISFHTNAIDWVTLVPNIGLEIDLKDSPKNNYSVSIFGKYNANSTHGSLVYNVAAVRVEGRKYWRTGKYGKKYYTSYDRLYTDSSDSVYYNGDKYEGIKYYIDSLEVRAHELGVNVEIDSIGVKYNKFRNWFYNTYHKTRRNVFSGRTLENPRNWRAYYFGLWAGYDKWNVSLTGNGKRGQGLGLGILGGYTIPLLPQKYPKEGSLDLDLGLAIGVKGVKYDAYTYVATNPEGQRYVDNPAKSQTSWKVVPYPVIQDIHVSLIWRFRGIKNKVDKSLIDDYEQQVSKFSSNITEAYNRSVKIDGERERLISLIKERTSFLSDSSALWNRFHLRRIENARRINPDTVLTDADQYLYLKITENLDTTAAKKRLVEYKDSIEVAARKAARQAQRDSIATARQARRDSIAARRDSIATADSIAEVLRDASRKFKRDSIAAADSIAKALRIARRDSIAAADSIADALREAERKARRDSIAAADSLAKAMKKEERKNKAKKKKDKDAPVEESGNSAETPVLPVGEDEDAQQGDVKKDEE